MSFNDQTFAYKAARAYRDADVGITKPGLAAQLSEKTGRSYDVCREIIEAIDAYEDVREGES